MTPLTFALAFAVFALACLGTGIWLSLHLTALAAMFHGRADVVASPRPPRASREMVVSILTGFGLSLAGVLGIQLIALGAWN